MNGWQGVRRVQGKHLQKERSVAGYPWRGERVGGICRIGDRFLMKIGGRHIFSGRFGQTPENAPDLGSMTGTARMNKRLPTRHGGEGGGCPRLHRPWWPCTLPPARGIHRDMEADPVAGCPGDPGGDGVFPGNPREPLAGAGVARGPVSGDLAGHQAGGRLAGLLDQAVLPVVVCPDALAVELRVDHPVCGAAIPGSDILECEAPGNGPEGDGAERSGNKGGGGAPSATSCRFHADRRCPGIGDTPPVFGPGGHSFHPARVRLRGDPHPHGGDGGHQGSEGSAGSVLHRQPARHPGISRRLCPALGLSGTRGRLTIST